MWLSDGVYLNIATEFLFINLLWLALLRSEFIFHNSGYSEFIYRND